MDWRLREASRELVGSDRANGRQRTSVDVAAACRNEAVLEMLEREEGERNGYVSGRK